MSSQLKGILFNIKNSQIQSHILLNVPFLKLMHLFQFSHSHQQLININFTSYEYLSKINPNFYNSINNSFLNPQHRSSPNNLLSQDFSLSYLINKSQIPISPPNSNVLPYISTLCYCPSTDNILFITNTASFLINNITSKQQFLESISSYPSSQTFTACIELSPSHAIVVISDSIYQISLPEGETTLIYEFNQDKKDTISLLSLTKVNSDLFIISDSKGTLHLFDNTKKQIVGTVVLNHYVKDLTQIKDSEMIFTAFRGNEVYLIDIKTNHVEKLLHTQTVFVVTSLSKFRIASGDSNGTIIIWNAFNGKQLCKMQGEKKFVSILIELPNKLMLAAGNYNEINIWNIKKGKKKGVLKKHYAPVIAMLLINNDTKVISSGLDRMVCIWNYDSTVCEVVIKTMLSAPRRFVQAKDFTIYYVDMKGMGRRLLLPVTEQQMYEKTIGEDKCFEFEVNTY